MLTVNLIVNPSTTPALSSTLLPPVQGVQLQGEAATKRADRDKDVRIPKLTEEDDIVAYLTTFERLMTAYEVKAECWAFKLATNLIGKAQQAYASLRVEDAGSYEKLYSRGTILPRRVTGKGFEE